MTTSNAAAVDKTPDKTAEKTGPAKLSEKLAEKRRALGRGLESLLPGPRVVPAPMSPTLPQSTRKDGAPDVTSSQFPVLSSQRGDSSSSDVGGGRAGTPGAGLGPLRDPENRVSPKAVRYWMLEQAFGFVLMLVGAIALANWIPSWSWLPDWLSGNSWLLIVAVVVVVLPFAVAEPFVRYAVHRWELSADVVYSRSGFLTKEWVFVPVSRIQTVDKKQGWTERVFGLATLEVRTASHAGSSTIKGLDHEVAAALAERLARRAEELKDDAT